MNLKSGLLWAAILFVAAIGFAVPMLVSGGRIRRTHYDNIVSVTISPSATISATRVSTTETSDRIVFSPTASFTATASTQPSQTPNPTITPENTNIPTQASTFLATPTATHVFVTFTSRPTKKSLNIPVPPTNTPQPKATDTQKPVPTQPPPTQPPPTNPPPTLPPVINLPVTDLPPINVPPTEAPTDSPFTSPP